MERVVLRWLLAVALAVSVAPVFQTTVVTRLELGSVADLAAFPSDRLSDGVTALVLGYYILGDGGGGQFVWDARCTTPPNGGTIVGGAARRGRWRRACDGPVDVRWFGAKGDGVADDTRSIQAAVQDAPGELPQIRISDGSYLVSAPISIKRRIRLEGPGRIVAGLSYRDGGFGGIITVDVKSGNLGGVGIEGLTIDGSGKPTYGIYLYGAGKHTVKGCHFSNLTRTAIGSSSTTNDCEILNNIVVKSGDFHHSAINVVGSRSKMVGNVVLNCIGKGIVVGGTQSVAFGNTVRYDPTTAADTSDGIYLDFRSSNCSVVGNMVAGARGNGIKATAATVGHVVTTNVVHKGPGVGWGILLQGASDCLVANNIVRMADAKAAIYLGRNPGHGWQTPTWSRNNVIRGNFVRGLVRSDSKDVNIEGNCGILIYDGSSQNSVVGNNISRFTAGIVCSFSSDIKLEDNKITECVMGVDARAGRVALEGNGIDTSGQCVNLRGGTNNSIVRNNRLKTHAIACLEIANSAQAITVIGNTFE